MTRLLQRPAATPVPPAHSLTDVLDRTVDATLPLAEQAQEAVSLTPAGHLRPLHWAALGLFLWLLGVAPILVGIREDWVLELPLALSLAGGWCFFHAFASAAVQDRGGEEQ